MANLVKAQRKYADSQATKLAEGTLVSDQETKQFQDKAETLAQQGLAAQQKSLTQTQAALAGGGPVASGAVAQGQKALGQAASGAAVKASGQAQTMASALREQRRGQALGVISEQADLQRQKRQRAQKIAMAGVEAAGTAVATLLGGPAAGATVGNIMGGFNDNVNGTPGAAPADAGQRQATADAQAEWQANKDAKFDEKVTDTIVFQ